MGNNSSIPINLLKRLNDRFTAPTTNQFVSGESRLVRIPPKTWSNERVRKEEWAGGDSNSGPPPCQGGILTRLDHRPNIQ
jgi:hypothetical protein